MGCLFLLGAAMAWSVTILHIRHHRWTTSPLALAPWQMLLAAIPLTGCAWAVEGAPHLLAVNDGLLGLLVFIGPVATSACVVISAEHGRRITTFAMSNFTLGVPLIGIVASWLFLGNRITGVFLIGLIFVFAGAVLAPAAGRLRRAEGQIGQTGTKQEPDAPSRQGRHRSLGPGRATDDDI